MTCARRLPTLSIEVKAARERERGRGFQEVCKSCLAGGRCFGRGEARRGSKEADHDEDEDKDEATILFQVS